MAPESREGKERSTTAAGLFWSTASRRRVCGGKNTHVRHDSRSKGLPARRRPAKCQRFSLKRVTGLHFTDEAAAESSPACSQQIPSEATTKLESNKVTQKEGGEEEELTGNLLSHSSVSPTRKKINEFTQVLPQTFHQHVSGGSR